MRRTLYLSFFAIFFIVGAALLFYLQGYRYNQDKGKIERTGALVVESVPEEAKVIVNGELNKRPTPVALQSLQAGDYEVAVELAGFQPWKKTLNVKPSRVTFTGKIRLWSPAQPGDLVSNTAEAETFPSPDGEHLLYRLHGGLSAGLWLMNLASGKTVLLARPSAETTATLAWSPSSRQILSYYQNDAKHSQPEIYDLADASWETVNLPDSLSPRLVRWGEDDHLLYAATNDELYQWNRRTNSTRLVWRQAVSDFRLHDDLIFALTRSQGGTTQLTVLNRNNLQAVPLEQPPQLAEHASFLEARDEWLPLLDEDRHAIYLLHSPLTELAPVRKIPNVLSLDWDQAGERLLLTNNIEIWEYRIADDKLSLRERVGEPITRSRFFGEEQYIISASATKVWALELDDRGERQRWLLAEYDSPVEDIYLDEKNRTLTVETAKGFYRLKLRQEPDGVLPKVRL